jgi:O-antigen ligase
MDQESNFLHGATSRGRQLVILVCGAVLAFSPLAFAAVHPWAYFSVGLIIAGLGLILLAVALFRLRVRGAQQWSLPYPPLWWLAAGLGLLTVLQAAPWPQELVRAVSPRGWEIRSLGGGFGLADYLPFTLNLDATLLEMLKLGPAVVLFFVLLYTVNRRGQIRGLVWLILAVALFEVVYGFWNYRTRLIWGWPNPYTGNRLCGTFINSNHLALYLAMAILLGYGFFLGKRVTVIRPPRGSTLRDRIRLWSRAEYLEPQVRRLLLLCLLLVLTIGLFFTGSRGGVLALVSGFVLMPVFSWGLRRGKSRVLLIAVLLAGALIYTFSLGGAWVLDRFQETNLFRNRYYCIIGALSIFREFPLIGSGIGTFGDLFYRFEPQSMGMVYMLYAHNDWLQLLAEAGIPGFLLGAWVMGAFLLTLLEAWRQQGDPFAQGLGLGGMAALGAAIIHSLVDFPFHIPALTLTFAAVAAITYLTVYSRPRGLPFTYPLLKFPRLRWVASGIIFVLMAAQLAFAYQVCYHWLAEMAAPTAIDSTRGSREIEAADFRRALALNPRNSKYYLGLAEALNRERPGESAGEVERLLQAVVFEAPGSWFNHQKLAEFYLIHCQRDPSRYVPLGLEELAATVKLYPGSVELHLYLSTVLAWAEKNYPGFIPPGLRGRSAFHYQEAKRLDPWLVKEMERLGRTQPR